MTKSEGKTSVVDTTHVAAPSFAEQLRLILDWKNLLSFLWVICIVLFVYKDVTILLLTLGTLSTLFEMNKDEINQALKQLDLIEFPRWNKVLRYIVACFILSVILFNYSQGVNNVAKVLITFYTDSVY